MYARNKNICLKLRNICFAKFIDSLKITSQVIKFASQLRNAKREFVPCIYVYIKLFFSYLADPQPALGYYVRTASLNINNIVFSIFDQKGPWQTLTRLGP